MITGCSNQQLTKSVTDDKVIITGPPGQFTTAYHMAQKECQKNTKNAEYIPDDTAAGLEVVAFNCVGEEAEEVSTETEEAPAETEEVSTEAEEVSPQEN